jgi:hypothetical protein
MFEMEEWIDWIKDKRKLHSKTKRASTAIFSVEGRGKRHDRKQGIVLIGQ